MGKTPTHSFPRTAPKRFWPPNPNLAFGCLACGSNTEIWVTLLTKGLLQTRKGPEPRTREGLQLPPLRLRLLGLRMT